MLKYNNCSFAAGVAAVGSPAGSRDYDMHGSATQLGTKCVARREGKGAIRQTASCVGDDASLDFSLESKLTPRSRSKKVMLAVHEPCFCKHNTEPHRQ